MAVMSMWTRLQPVYAANMWNEALNKRLGTEVCRLLLILILPHWVLGIHNIVLIQASLRLKQSCISVKPVFFYWALFSDIFVPILIYMPLLQPTSGFDNGLAYGMVRAAQR